MFDIDDRGEMDQEKKMRREIANSNERRRMQSINAGFQSLRTLLPHHHDGEKLSKAAILQQTAEYIYSLEQEKTRLLSQNCQLKRLLSVNQQVYESDSTEEPSQIKRKRNNHIPEGEENIVETRIVTEQICGMSEDKLDTTSAVLNDMPGTIQIHDRGMIRCIKADHTQLIPSDDSSYSQLIVQPSISNFHHELIENPITDSTQCTLILNPVSIIPTGDSSTTVLLPMDPVTASHYENNIIDTNPHRTDTTTLSHLLTTSDPASVTVVVEPLTTSPLKSTEDVSIGFHDSADSILSVSNTCSAQPRSFLITGTSRQNLDSIVEAIRHLEGDHLFSEDNSAAPQRKIEDGGIDVVVNEINLQPLAPTANPNTIQPESLMITKQNFFGPSTANEDSRICETDSTLG